ncbi:MAG TPA: Gfo/Idh/MocA family oxidoreductase [Pseudolabrys sp.]|nr:Gfo/Idh/MocA family oxidoreductase [Pseudolabrys sp.]
MIRLGIVGCNYGRLVHAPAFRLDERCRVVALAGTDAPRTEALAREASIDKGYGDWQRLVDDANVDAVTIATPPALQPQIAQRALALGKPVFIEKPMAADIAGARAMLDAAHSSRRPAMIDFTFYEIESWRRMKAMLDAGAIGALRHVMVSWHVENQSTRLRLRNWKTTAQDGGGVLGNFVSHCFYYLEWFCGPINGLSARISPLPGSDGALEAMAAMTLAFRSGASGSLTMSNAAYLGSGHRVELYGEDGTLVLANTTLDYMRGFTLHYAKRPAEALALVPIDDPAERLYPDGRIAPVSRLAKRFLDAVEQGEGGQPDFQDGYRVQQLIAAARTSHDQGRWLDMEKQA